MKSMRGERVWVSPWELVLGTSENTPYEYVDFIDQMHLWLHLHLRRRSVTDRRPFCLPQRTWLRIGLCIRSRPC
jgi:hypothetical protein